MHGPAAAASSATISPSTMSAGSGANSPASTELSTVGTTASSPRTNVPPTHTPAAATHGRNLKVRRFFTETSRGKKSGSTFRETRARIPDRSRQRSNHRGGIQTGAGRHPRPGRQAPEGTTRRDRKGLRCRQTPLPGSCFPDRKTQPTWESSDDSGRAGGTARLPAESPPGGGQPPAIGPPSQQVSRIAPHRRQMSFARSSKVGPVQTGQQGVVMR